MSFEEMDFNRPDAADLIIERLLRFGKPFNYSDTVSLKFYQKNAVSSREAIVDFNATLALLKTKYVTVKTCLKTDETTQKALRRSIGGAEGLDSDAYVAAGGARQSEVTAKQQATKEENKKAAEVKKKADAEIVK